VSLTHFCELKIFEATFSVKYKIIKDKSYWITQGIKVSYKHKRSLYAFSKNNNDPKAKVHYIKCCKILRKVITEDKKQ
jgi:hypothetical protein